MNHRRCKRRDKENQACGHAEAENISIANAFPYALPVVRAAVLCHICVDCLCHRGKRHHRERKQLSCGSMSRNCFIAEAVDARLQDNRTDIDNTAHKSHRKSLCQKLHVQSAIRFKMTFFRKQNFCFGNNINQAEHDGNSLRNHGCNCSTANTHAERTDKQQIQYNVYQR